MFKSIYNRLKEDFDFLMGYGYSYKYPIKHFEVPAILYGNDKFEIVMGINYREERFYINIFANGDDLNALKPLDNVKLPGKAYKDQVDIVKKYLMEYLNDNEWNSRKYYVSKRW